MAKHESLSQPGEGAPDGRQEAAPQPGQTVANPTAREAHLIVARSLRDHPDGEWNESVVLRMSLPDAPDVTLSVSAFAEAQPLDEHPSPHVALHRRLGHAGVPVVVSYDLPLRDPDAIAGYSYLLAKPAQLSPVGHEGELGALFGRPAAQVAGYIRRFAPYPEAPAPSVQQIGTAIGYTGLKEMLNTSYVIATTHIGLEESAGHEVLGPDSDPAHWERLQLAMDTMRGKVLPEDGGESAAT